MPHILPWSGPDLGSNSIRFGIKFCAVLILPSAFEPARRSRTGFTLLGSFHLFQYTRLALSNAENDYLRLVWGGQGIHLLQIGVAPGPSVGEHSRDESALAVVLHLLCGGSPLDAGDLASAGVCQVHRHQLTAGHPQGGVPRGVVNDLQEEFTVVVVYLLRPQRSVVVHG